MEASKASTGNLPVNPEVCDATVVLTQIVGEFSEKAEANQLEMVVECPQPPVEIYVDGRHLWRIIDNLMGNICKYAQPGTRVYVTLETFHGMVIMTFRNISKDRLKMTSEELFRKICPWRQFPEYGRTRTGAFYRKKPDRADAWKSCGADGRRSV